MVPDRRDQRGKVVRLAKRLLLDGLEDLLEVGVDRMRPVRVRVPEVFNVLSEVAEKEDVVLADLPSDLNLSTGVSLVPERRQRPLLPAYISAVARPNNEAAVEDKLHVASARGPVGAVSSTSDGN